MDVQTREKEIKGKTVSIVYAPGLNTKEDQKLDALAKEHGGDRVSSGCMIGDGHERDMQFEFSTKAQAKKFFEALKFIGYRI